MDTGLRELFKYQKEYCILKIMYDNCKWWEFNKKKEIREQLDWISPLMKAEIRFITRIK